MKLRFLFLGILLLGSFPLEAQRSPVRFSQRSSEEVARAEADCRRTGTRLLTSSDPMVQRAEMIVAVSCPDSGAALLAERWKTPPTDSTALFVLAGVSRQSIDARIADAALSVVQNRGAGLKARVPALEAVVGQFGVWLTFGRMAKTRSVSATGAIVQEVDVVQVLMRSNDSYEAHRGKVPVTDADKERIIAALRELARGPDDPYMLLAIKEALEVLVPGKR